MTDLVTRTAAIANRARSAAPTRAELRAKYPEFAGFMDEIRKHFGAPAWYELREGGRIFYQFGECPDQSKWKCVPLSPKEPIPVKGKRA